MDNLKRIAYNLNVEPLLVALNERPELWKQNTVRQTFEGTAHHDTETIFARGPSEFTVEEYMGNVDAYDYEATHIFSGTLLPLMGIVLTKLKCKQLGYILIVNLKAGGYIDAHIDEGAYAEHYERYHLVLSSEEGNLFTCGDDSVHMKAGELWWFNHREKHAVINKSGKDRVHIIFDVVRNREDSNEL